jgi:hypothetical protein
VMSVEVKNTDSAFDVALTQSLQDAVTHFRFDAALQGTVPPHFALICTGFTYQLFVLTPAGDGKFAVTKSAKTLLLKDAKPFEEEIAKLVNAIASLMLACCPLIKSPDGHDELITPQKRSDDEDEGDGENKGNDNHNDNDKRWLVFEKQWEVTHLLSIFTAKAMVAVLTSAVDESTDESKRRLIIKMYEHEKGRTLRELDDEDLKDHEKLARISPALASLDEDLRPLRLGSLSFDATANISTEDTVRYVLQPYYGTLVVEQVAHRCADDATRFALARAVWAAVVRVNEAAVADGLVFFDIHPGNLLVADTAFSDGGPLQKLCCGSFQVRAGSSFEQLAEHLHPIDVGAFYSIGTKTISKDNLRHLECAPGSRRSFRLHHYLSKEGSEKKTPPPTLAGVLGDALCIIWFVMHPSRFTYVIDRHVSRERCLIKAPELLHRYATELSEMAQPPEGTDSDPWEWDGKEAVAVRDQMPSYLEKMDKAITNERAKGYEESLKLKRK